MSRFIMLGALVGLAGCLNEDKFTEQYADAACAEQTICDEAIAELVCNPPAVDDAVEAVESTCDFDKAAAKDCLDGAWSCSEFDIAVPPSACANVCGSTDAGDDDDDDDDDDSDTDS